MSSSSTSTSRVKKKKKISDDDDDHTSLPLDVIIKILVKLPVKSLLRFRCVSKLFAALISHPKFANMHLLNSPREGLIFHSRALHCVDPSNLSSANNFVAVEDKVLKKILENKRRKSLTVVGSCNGLLCVKVGTWVFFYNPNLKKYKQINDSGSRYRKAGFGYVKSIDDYKFVKFNEDLTKISVYSLREKKWNHIHNNFPLNTRQQFGIHLNGSLHWLVDDSEGQALSIAAFDLIEERFKTLPLDDIMIQSIHHVHFLEVFNGYLCCVINHAVDTKIQLWIMKEYGVKGSWVQLLRVEGHRFCKPLCFLNDGSGSVLVHMDLELLMYLDPRDGFAKSIVIEGIRREVPHVHVESLIAPSYDRKKPWQKKMGKILDNWL